MAAVLFAMALACGGGPRKAPVQEDATPSLGDLLGTPPATPGPTPGQGTSTAPVAPLVPPPLVEVAAPTAAQDPEESPETPECTRARMELRERRAHVDDQRIRELGSLEQSLAAGQLALQNCIKTSPCNRDAELMAAAEEKANSAQRAYQAAMERVGAWEAELFPYEQEMDRACGRR
jgi:type IV secretory pathway VirB10-like protein